LVWMAAIICMFLAGYPPMMATLLWLRKMCIWLRKGYIGHRKIWWGHGCTTPPCLHWYTTVTTRRHRNSYKWWHIILLRISFLGRGKTFSCNPSSFFSSPAQEVLPLTNLLSPQEKVLIFHPIGANLLWPLCSLLTDKRRIPLRSASVRTPHLFHHGIPKCWGQP
jgi:hypothetical protein